MAGALEGIKILELAQAWAAPGAVMYLADQGAQVIKVEPLAGDEARRFFVGAPLGGEDRGFLVLNRNKRSIAVDIRQPRGLEIVHRLLAGSDVFIHNFRPGVSEKLGLGYQKVRALHPRVIYVHLTPFGLKGPLAQMPAYDLVTQALAGVMHRRDHQGRPIPAGIWVADCSTAMMLAYAITLGLYARERTGKGQKVEATLVNQALAMQIVDLVRSTQELKKAAETYPIQHYIPYRCQDGQYIIQVAVTNDQWARVCGVLGLEHMAQDPELDSALKRARRGRDLVPILEAVFETRPRDEWDRLLTEADVPHAPILSREEVFNHPQFLANDIIVELEHPKAGKVKMVGIPFRITDHPGKIRTPAPGVGEHTREVLRELGYPSREIGKLAQEGIVGLAAPAGD